VAGHRLQYYTGQKRCDVHSGCLREEHTHNTHTHTHTEYVILIAFPRKQWLSERA